MTNSDATRYPTRKRQRPAELKGKVDLEDVAWGSDPENDTDDDELPINEMQVQNARRKAAFDRAWQCVDTESEDGQPPLSSKKPTSSGLCA